MRSLAGKFRWVSRDTNIFLILKAFGAGVILATGFIHMFPDASKNFENPCLGEHLYLCRLVTHAVRYLIVSILSVQCGDPSMLIVLVCHIAVEVGAY